jgi:signal transduction histidine kinase/ligand-binding sensor domain-containing protein/DNA-binding response OmpR family regulator
LPYPVVTCIGQDHFGFLWVGTQEGLARYDGTSFLIFKHNHRDSNSLLSNYISDLATDGKGNIWCITSEGASVYDPIKQRFTNLRSSEEDPSLLTSGLTQVHIDKDDNAWMGSWSGLNFVSAGEHRVTRYVHDPHDTTTVADTRITGVLQDRQGRIWVATFSGLDLFDPKTRTFKHIRTPAPLPPDSKGPLISRIYEDKEGSLWMTTWGAGIIKYAPATGQSDCFLPEPEVPRNGSTNVCVDLLHTDYPGEEDFLWIASKSAGLLLFDMRTGKFSAMDMSVPLSPSFVTSDINCVLDDGMGSLFAGTGNGLLRMSRTQQLFRTVAFPLLKDLTCLKDIFTLYEDPADSGRTWWIGTWTCGALRYDSKTGGMAIIPELSDLRHGKDVMTTVNAFRRDASGILYAASGHGLFKLDESTGRWSLVVLEADKPRAATTSLKVSRSGDLVVGTTDGLYFIGTSGQVKQRIRPEDLVPEKRRASLPGINRVNDFVEYPEGIFWLVGSRHALLRFDRNSNSLRLYSHEDLGGERFPFRHEGRSLVLDDRNIIWITSHGGLTSFDPTKEEITFTVYTTADGLPSQNLYDIAAHDDRIWIATHNGLASLDRTTNQFRNYSVSDGLRATALGSIHVGTSTGHVYVLGNGQIQVLPPDRIGQGAYCGPLYLTAIKVLNEDYISAMAAFVTDTIRLSYRDKEITLSFAMLNYDQQEQIRYDYWLEGFNDTWVPNGARNYVSFTNLKGGIYKLHVRGYNAEGECADRGVLLTIMVTPPFWETNLFYGLCAIVLVGGVTTYNRLRVRSLKRQKRQLEGAVALRTEELREQKERAERSEQFEKEFLANMSHEIRTPMNAVIGMTKVLLEKNPREDQHKYLDTIRKSSDALLVIINDILDLSKVAAGRLEIEAVPFSPREAVALVHETLSHKAQEKRLDFTIDLDDSLPRTVVGDPTRLQQILTNLAGNAIKFTEKGGVTLSVKSEVTGDRDCRIMFTVTDTGIGLTEEQVSKLFKPFIQAASDTTRKYGGSGLGLSISKQLVELQGGHVSVESKPGEGSTFSFAITYPVSAEQAAPAATTEATGEMVHQLTGLRVLLVDDNEHNREVATEILNLKVPKVSVMEAENGSEAINRLQSGQFDVILMDVQMPVMDGLEATRRIRSGSTYADIPIIGLTASVLRADIDECLEAGMNACVPKPFKTSELLSVLHQVAVRGMRKVESELSIEHLESGDGRDETPDLSHLRQIADGEPSRVRKFIDIYLRHTPTSIERIRNAMSDNDHEALRIALHSFKPQARTMGLKGMAQRLELLEEDLQAGIAADLDGRVDQLLEEMRRSLEMFKEASASTLRPSS